MERVDDVKYWILICMATYENYNIIIGAIYRSPSYSESEFCDVFDEIVDEICNNGCDTNYNNCDILLAGDFNIDWSRNSTYKNKIKCILEDSGMKQMVNNYTRCTKTSNSIIDYVITNNYDMSVTNSFTNKIADHETINISIENLRTSVQENNCIEIFKYDKNLFGVELANKFQYMEIYDINQNVITLDSIFEETVRKFTSNREEKKLSIVNNWFNRQLQDMKKEKVLKYMRAKLEKTNQAWANYNKIRNMYKVKIDNAKNTYINNKINSAKDQKQMWRRIKDLVLNKKSQNMIKTVIFDQEECNENQDIANKFNKFFVDSINDIRESIGYVQYENSAMCNTSSSFKFHAIDLQELKIIIKKMKNKSDHHKISNKIILDNWSITGDFLLKIINDSLQSGVFPDNWKETIISPVEKVQRTMRCEEYRPINTLKTFEKILEKVVKNQMEEYIERNKILSKYQSGFRKNFSCETTVNYLISRLKIDSNKKKIMAMFLDFKRAFETIDRQILIEKLFTYGVKGVELKWFKSYLENRRQITKVNGTTSTDVRNEYGVPQGSILGALLFIIYINDMPNILQKCDIFLYADDTLIYAIGDTDDECRANLRHDK